MNVSYEARFEEGKTPALCKVVSTDTESVVTALSLSNTEEVALFSDDLIWEHLRNLVAHLNSLAGSVTIVSQGVMPDSGWPVSGWNDMVKIHEEILQWWIYVTQRDEEIQIIHNLVG